MDKPQPSIVPPMARIPQVPPQQVAGNRRVYIPPTFRRAATPANRTVPQTYTQNRHVYTAPPLTRLPAHQHSPISQQVMQMPDRQIAPAIRLPVNLRKPLMQQRVPETPGLLSSQWPPIREIDPDMPHMGIPITPPCSIPGYFPTEAKRQEPGPRETLLGCGILLLIGVFALIILYYLAT